MMYILGMNNTQDVATGEIWKLGNHILMCGSSLSSEDVNELFGDRVAEMLFTSPPYSDQRDYKQGHNNLAPESVAKVIPIYKDHARFQCVNLGYKFVKFSIDTYWNYYINEALGCGLKLLAWNIWDKNGCIGIGAQTKMFPTMHEFIFVFGEQPKKLNLTVPKKHKMDPNRTHTTKMDCKGVWVKHALGDTTRTHKPMDSIARVTAQRDHSATGDQGHPAPFPVGLPKLYIEAMTKEGEYVADCFAGSGTTLIACEQLGRKAICMEYSREYCQLIINRWEALTSQKAELIKVGK